MTGIVHPKMKILENCTHPQVVPSLYNLYSFIKHKRRSLVECPSCSLPYNESGAAKRERSGIMKVAHTTFTLNFTKVQKLYRFVLKKKIVLFHENLTMKMQPWSLQLYGKQRIGHSD